MTCPRVENGLKIWLLFIQSRNEAEGRPRGSALCLAAASLLSLIHINSSLWHGRMILHDPRRLLDTQHVYILASDGGKHSPSTDRNKPTWTVKTNERWVNRWCWKIQTNWEFGENIPACFIFPSVSKLMASKPKLQHETSTTEAWKGESGVAFLRLWASRRRTKDSRAPRARSV